MSATYVFAMAPCLNCGVSFSFNPNKVPSMRVHGEKEPICGNCMGLINAQRKEMGLPPFSIEPDAYQPIPESEL